MSRLIPNRAAAIISSAIEKGTDMGLKPLAVAVLDAGGHLISFARQDGASIRRFQIAVAKASGALFMGFSSRKAGEIAAERRPGFIAAVAHLAPAGLIPTAGGIIVLDEVD
jgi:uncharacterized protein GlcG (DUF336 family)